MKKEIYFILFILFIISCSNKTTGTNTTDTVVEYPDIVQKNYVHYIYKNGRKYLITTVSEAVFYEKKKQIICKDVHAEIFNTKEEISTVIDADKGVINKSSKTIEFTGNVFVQMIEEETTVYAEELNLDYHNNILKSDKPVKIKKEDGSYINSNSLRSDLKKEETKFTDMEMKYFYDDEKKE